MSKLPKMQPDNVQIKMLRLARKKKFLTIRDYTFWQCEDLLHMSAVDKYVPKKGRGAGWPHYKLSSKGRKFLIYLDKHPRHPHKY